MYKVAEKASTQADDVVSGQILTISFTEGYSEATCGLGTSFAGVGYFSPSVKFNCFIGVLESLVEFV